MTFVEFLTYYVPSYIFFVIYFRRMFLTFSSSLMAENTQHIWHTNVAYFTFFSSVFFIYLCPILPQKRH